MRGAKVQRGFCTGWFMLWPGNVTAGDAEDLTGLAFEDVLNILGVAEM